MSSSVIPIASHCTRTADSMPSVTCFSSSSSTAFATSSSASSYPLEIRYSLTSAISPFSTAAIRSSEALFLNSKEPSSSRNVTFPVLIASSMLSRPTDIPDTKPIMSTMKIMITRYFCQSPISSLGTLLISGFFIIASSLPLELGSGDLLIVNVVMADDAVTEFNDVISHILNGFIMRNHYYRIAELLIAVLDKA